MSDKSHGESAHLTDRGPPYRTVDWVDGRVRLIDQTALPSRLTYLELDEVSHVVDAIQRLAVRGAPAIGVTGAFGVALAVRDHGADRHELHAAVRALREARPTAVNLARMVDRTAALANEGFDRVLCEAKLIRDEELTASTQMGDIGADLVMRVVGKSSVRCMTICNTGGLATVERGTALAVIHTLHERAVLDVVLACETRPLLQGARLTMWELAQIGAPAQLIVDAAGPALIATGAVDFVIAGADRIAANGDSANKIGTYSLALAAARARIPFFIVAPESTVDLSLSDGSGIEIEDRSPAEVVAFRGVSTTPNGTDAVNPAFDVTPADLITAIVTDRRIVRVGASETFADVPFQPC